jgi:hypothetical protein
MIFLARSLKLSLALFLWEQDFGICLWVSISTFGPNTQIYEMWYLRRVIVSICDHFSGKYSNSFFSIMDFYFFKKFAGTRTVSYRQKNSTGQINRSRSTTLFIPMEQIPSWYVVQIVNKIYNFMQPQGLFAFNQKARQWAKRIQFIYSLQLFQAYYSISAINNFLTSCCIHYENTNISNINYNCVKHQKHFHNYGCCCGKYVVSNFGTSC